MSFLAHLHFEFTPQLLGSLSLNISFVLYLINYIPQLFHNHKTTNLEQLSLGFHCLLFASYSLDLFYGFASDLPWQYRTVSVVGLILLSIQHIQLSQFFLAKNQILKFQLNTLILILTCCLIYYFFIILNCQLNAKVILITGSISRFCGLMYYYPQIIKNITLKSAKALSLNYIYLNLILAILDTISAWCLSWGWPNKLSAPLGAILMLVVVYQTKKYRFAPGLYNVGEIKV